MLAITVIYGKAWITVLSVTPSKWHLRSSVGPPVLAASAGVKVEWGLKQLKPSSKKEPLLPPQLLRSRSVFFQGQLSTVTGGELRGKGRQPQAVTREPSTSPRVAASCVLAGS